MGKILEESTTRILSRSRPRPIRSWLGPSSTLLGVGTELTLGDGQSDLIRTLQQSAQQSTNAAGQRLVEKNLNIQPTITVRPGWPLRVIVEKDLVLRPYRG